MTIPLPMARGDTWPSGTQGSPPADIRGMTMDTPKGVRLRLVRNGGSTILSGCQAVEWMSGAGSAAAWVGDVQKNSTAKNEAFAGVVDHVYAEKNKGVAVGALFWMIEHGIAYIESSGTSIVHGSKLAPEAGVGLAHQATFTAVCGVALQTQATDARSTLAYLRKN